MEANDYDVISTIEKFKAAGLEEEFARLFHHLKLDIFQLRSQWRTYVQLFGTNKERVDLLNSVSGVLSATLERTLFEATLLGLRRITDPKNSKGGKVSVTLKAVVDYLPEKDQGDFKRLVNEAVRAADFARDWSNKKIAHADFEYRNGQYRLKPASRNKVAIAIDKAADVVRWVEKAKFNTTLVTHPIAPAEDEVWFLQTLFEGREAILRKRENSRTQMIDGKLAEAEKLLEYPEWLDRSEIPMDI